MYSNPKGNVLRDESGEVLYEDTQLYVHELQEYVPLKKPLFEYTEPLQKRVTLTLNDGEYYDKFFCEDCYGAFLKTTVDELVSTLTNFKSTKE